MQSASIATGTPVAPPAGDESARLGVVDASPHRVWAESAADIAAMRIAPIHHDFHRHPLMQVARLAELAARLWPEGQCRFMAPGVRDTSAMEASVRLRNPSGYRIEETFSHLDEPGTWVSLYNVETDPDYREFLVDVMACASPLLPGREQDILRICGYVFISAPPSVTPFHLDRENNFWLQIRGHKSITVWDRRDRDVVAAADIEQFLVTGSLAGVRLDEALRSRGQTFSCGPGDGVFFPSTSPHLTRSDPDWVTPGDGVAISIGVVFYTRETLAQARVHLCNQALRRFGVRHPAFPGNRPRLDALKQPIGRALAARRKTWSNETAWSFDVPGY